MAQDFLSLTDICVAIKAKCVIFLKSEDLVLLKDLACQD